MKVNYTIHGALELHLELHMFDYFCIQAGDFNPTEIQAIFPSRSSGGQAQSNGIDYPFAVASINVTQHLARCPRRAGMVPPGPPGRGPERDGRGSNG